MLGGRRTSASRLELLVEQLPSSFVWTVSPDLRLTALAGSALALLGVRRPGEVVGKELAVLVAETSDGGGAVVDAHLRALAGESVTLTETWRQFAFDVRVQPLRDGEEVVGAGGIAVDASKRHAAERALAASEARFRTLVERLPICTYVNPLGFPITTTYISPQIETLLGFPAERWLTEDDFWISRLHPDDRERAVAGANRAHETGEPFRDTYRLIAQDGRVVHLLDETIPVSDERGRPLFLQGFLLEVGPDAAV